MIDALAHARTPIFACDRGRARGYASRRAATVSAVRSTLTFDEAPGEANDVTILRAPSAFRSVDAGAVVAPGVGRTATAAIAVECPAARIERIVVRLGDRDDVVTASVSAPTRIVPGSGDDRLEGGEGPDLLEGEEGDDELFSGGGGDDLDGGAGADRLSGGVETDPFDFGAALYDRREARVVVSLDGVANDGEWARATTWSATWRSSSGEPDRTFCAETTAASTASSAEAATI